MTSHAQNDEPRSISRRRIVRSAATLAWTVPAVQLASAVPAFAGSGNCCNLSVTGSANWRTGELNYIDIPVTISDNCGTGVSGLMVTLTICGVDGITYAGDQDIPAGWVPGGAANKPLDADGNGCYVLTFTSGQSLGGNQSTSPTFTLKTKSYNGPNRPAGSITATVSTSGCSSQTTAISLPETS